MMINLTGVLPTMTNLTRVKPKMINLTRVELMTSPQVEFGIPLV